MTMTERVKSGARTVDTVAGGLEAIALAATCRLAGWVASIPTIMLTSRSCEVIFELSPGAAVASAIALELVGQSVTATWLRAKEWNKSKRKTDPKANELLALAMTVGYFVTDFTLIATLQVPKALVNPVHWAALLFPLAQVISTVVTSERTAQFKREADVEAEKAKRKAARLHKRSAQRMHRNDAQDVHKGNGKVAQEGAQVNVFDAINRTRRERKQQITSALLDAYEGNPELGASEAARLVGVHRNTVYNYIAELQAAGRLRSNGQGWEVLP